MTTRQQLAILHTCRERNVADVNAWPEFLFGKKLNEINQAEAAELLRHLELLDPPNGVRP